MQAAQCSTACKYKTFTFGKVCAVFLRSVSIGVSHRFWTSTKQDTGQKGQPYQKVFSIKLHRIITRHKIVEPRPKSWAGKLCGIKGPFPLEFKTGLFLFSLLAFSSFSSELDSWHSQDEYAKAIGKKRLNGQDTRGSSPLQERKANGDRENQRGQQKERTPDIG